MNLRIGHGFDIHPFAEGRPLFLGGVKIPSNRGLQGHSDADALLHALTDAILGALGLEDIGHWFPNTDERWRNVSSLRLLEEVWSRATEDGWRLVNCDVVVLAEKPKIKPYIDQMKDRIAEVLNAQPDQIGIKATTMEKLGAIGREEGIAASAVALLTR